MKDYLLGLFCGVMLCVWTVRLTPNEINSNRQKIIDCEKDLPRSQKCVMLAVPERK